MKYLNKKMKRDFKKNWTQFFSVFLMSFLSVLVFAGLQGAWHGLEVTLNNYIKESNLANSWVIGNKITPEDVEKIANLEGVEKIAQKTRIQVKNSESENKYLYLETLDDRITEPHQHAGSKLGMQENGVWINKEYAEKNKIDVGQQIELFFLDKKVLLTVQGIIQSADRIYYTGTEEFIAPNNQNYGYGYISKNTLEEKFGYKYGINLLELKGETKDIRKDLETILGKKLLAYYNQETLVDVSEPIARVGQIRNLSYMFSFIFVLLAILASYTTIYRIIEAQVKEIAILEAIGVKRKNIIIHYTSFGLIVGTTGALLGSLIAPLMSLYVLGTQKVMFSLPYWWIAYSFDAIAVIILVISISIIAAYFATRKKIKGLPVEYLRGENQKARKKVMIEKIPSIWQKINFAIRWTIRDSLYNKIRIFMGIVGVSGGMMIILAGIGMPQSINILVDKAYHEDFKYSQRLHIDNYEKNKNNAEGQWVQINQARFTPDAGYNSLLIVISEGEYVNAKTTEGKKIETGGIYVTEGFAKNAKIKTGDQVEVKPYADDKTYTFNVKGIITTETNQGAYITKETFENSNGTFKPTTLLVGEKDSTNDIKYSSTIYISEQEQNAKNFVKSLMGTFLMIVSFAILLVIIVLYNLGSLNFTERTRDYATLSVLGFNKKELRKITLIENTATTLVGWVIGIPLGFWFTDLYAKTFSTIRLEYTSTITPLNLIISTLIVVLFSMSTSIFISSRVKKINAVEALKGVD